MPARLRPTASIAADAILVGDPGRALMLAQELLQQPKMSNHARGLWGYSGLTHEGNELTVQSTGMGGPSATVVLHDLAELGVRRAVRIGTCTSLVKFKLGALVIVIAANEVPPNQQLTVALEETLGEEGHRGSVASLDVLHRHHPEPAVPADVADMQTAGLFAAADRLHVELAAVLIVSETNDGETLGDEELEDAAKRGGNAAAGVLSP
jgi:uridine phosphorylase